ncbi:M14 family metallopeptidase [Litchfieldia alkalitelluris]|uniref:M14 family metallopeptidase n=1 Tax=Litchfieldia alkalitelluris TaxID=304268 RepID=UPI000996F08A|nr:M14 family metallopeptidase [Litchfieldia alkalitelluris]
MSASWKFGNLLVQEKAKLTGYLEFPMIEEKLPVFLVNGQTEGPVVLIMGGIHGCEYTSIDAAISLGKSLDPNQVKGKVVVLPIANPASFYARSIYVHPKDQKNLNRMFPGKKDGTAAEQLAYWINETVFKQVDYMIDLHGGDMIEALVPFTIYHVTEDHQLVEKSKNMASMFEIKYVIGSTGQVPGSTYGTVAEQGKVAIIAEAGQQGILSQPDSVLLQDGVLNILKSIGLLEGEVKNYDSHHLSVFDWYRAEIQGLWYPNVNIGDEVKTGDLLGEIRNEFGEAVQSYYSSTTGVVLFLVTSLAINPNDPLLAVGE